MSDESGGVLFTEEAAERIAEAVRDVESMRTGRAPRAPRAQLRTPSASAVMVRCTSATADGDGNYPAIITWHDGTGWTDADLACVLKMADGSAAASGTRYLCRPSAEQSGNTVFVTEGGSGSSSGPTWTRYPITAADILVAADIGTDSFAILAATLPAGTWLMDAALHVETGIGGGTITGATCGTVRCAVGAFGLTGVPGEPVQLVGDILNAEAADSHGAAERQAINALGFGTGPGAFGFYGATEVWIYGTVNTPITDITDGLVAVWLVTFTP